jgi:DNA polymerase III delta prime subunit
MTVPIAFETTPFFGREDELRALDSLFASGVRIALLSGPPGIGKSRLAFEFAERMFPSRWWFSSSLSEGAALDERSQRLAVDSDLAGPSLIVLDDAESVIDLALAHAHRAVHRAAQLRVIVTSRRVALATGVALFSVHPLDPAAARSLLASRACLVSRDFDERALDAPSGLALRSSVGAIPAAIELAATRLRSLSADELSARLSDDHDPLWTDAIGVSPRHRSLRALVTDSFAALDPAGAALVVALSACGGDFSLDAAEALGAGPTPVVDALQSLADHSVLDRSTHEGCSRLALFAPLAQQIARPRPRRRASARPARARRTLRRARRARGRWALFVGRRPLDGRDRA